MARVLLLTVLWLLQAALIVLLANAEWVSSETAAERASIAAQFGDRRYGQVQSRASHWYEEWFVHSGAEAESYRRLLPVQDHPQHGMEGIAPWFFEWLRHRLDAFWSLMRQAIFRVQVLREWSLLIGLIALAAWVDGFVQRQIARSRHELASADRFLLARRVFLGLAFAPFLYLTLPLAVTPYVVPVWGLAFALTLMLLTAHAQHRF